MCVWACVNTHLHAHVPEWMCVNCIHAGTLEDQRRHQVSMELRTKQTLVLC